MPERLEKLDPSVEQNFIPSGVDRRTFLKLAGFTFAGTVLAGCQSGDVEKAIPFLIKPEEITPGVATWYATMCTGCQAGCGVMAKNRDGRPIKLEGNPNHPLSKGGLCAVGQALLLEVYDSHRLQGPLMGGKVTTWEALDAALVQDLESIRKSGGAVRFLTGTITSPSVRNTIRAFLGAFKNARHVVYDPLSSSAILDAHRLTHGSRILPRYHFDRADVIVSFDADFLGTWISPVEFTASYRAGRTLEGVPPKFSYHVQVESRVSLTGSNADRRICLEPAETRALIRLLAVDVAAAAGERVSIKAQEAGATLEQIASQLADRLWRSRGRSLLVCGQNDIHAQVLVNYINHLLGNYDTTVDVKWPSYQLQGDDQEFQKLLREIQVGEISALFIHGVNPVYDLPGGEMLADSLEKIPLTVSFSDRQDETASAVRFICPEPHAFERWEDAEAVDGVVSVAQPLIRPFGETRPMVESLSVWLGNPKSAYDLIQETWQRTVFKRQSAEKSFQTFWDGAVRDGFVEVAAPVTRPTYSFNASAISELGQFDVPLESSSGISFGLVLHPKIAIRDGRHAHNPWLQELPDPVTKIVWDNYASVSPSTASRLNLEEADVVRLEGREASIELPVHLQPGQHDAIVAIALGYGRKGTDRFTNIGPKWFEGRPTVPPGGVVGKNAARFLSLKDGLMCYDNSRVSVVKTGKRHQLATTQDHYSLRVPDHLAQKNGERRPIVQETTFAAYASNPASGSFPRPELQSLWPDAHTYPVHHWGMAIDLTACTGCSACVVSCQAENNIPVVGKDEVYRNRELTWIRIDRYYDDSGGNFSVAHQPMLCHQCDNAPCETVCPVLATVHSDEGLNQQVYNRCVGTRYCANNCPYKVRRFNWFDYPHGDDMQRLVLNPDVTVRERGIMEKCTFCVQRIQEAKIEAKKNGTPLKDGAIKPACQQSCPANAIVFGDTNDPSSEISKRMKDPRHYRVLEELGIRPSVGYLTLVRDREKGASVNG